MHICFFFRVCVLNMIHSSGIRKFDEHNLQRVSIVSMTTVNAIIIIVDDDDDDADDCFCLHSMRYTMSVVHCFALFKHIQRTFLFSLGFRYFHLRFSFDSLFVCWANNGCCCCCHCHRFDGFLLFLWNTECTNFQRRNLSFKIQTQIQSSRNSKTTKNEHKKNWTFYWFGQANCWP